LEFKKPLIPVLESSFLLLRQLQDSPDSLSALDSKQTNLVFLEKIFWGHKKLQLVLNDIRTFIDFEWNKIEIQTEKFSPQRIIHDLRNICQQHLLEKPNIKFRVDTISTIPDLVRGDQQKIRRVLEELLEMALDRVTDGHIKITCYMSGSQLCWIILDTGEMLTETQSQQLNEFYSGELTHSLESDGKLIFNFDFGSSIAAAFTHLLKGNISFQSETGHGNKCTAIFPVEI
jgi:K+-sensing histidine kinase KdpD